MKEPRVKMWLIFEDNREMHWHTSDEVRELSLRC